MKTADEYEIEKRLLQESRWTLWLDDFVTSYAGAVTVWAVKMAGLAWAIAVGIHWGLGG